MDLETYFNVTDRTLRRWKADGVNLQCAASLCSYLRNLARPSPGVEARICSPTFEADVEQILNPNQTLPLSSHDLLQDLAGDTEFVSTFDLSKLPDGPSYGPSDFSARVLDDVRSVITGLDVMVRLLERDPELHARYGNPRAVFAGGGPPVDDRDLLTLLITAEGILSAQAHRLRKCLDNVKARMCSAAGTPCPSPNSAPSAP